MLIRGGFPVGGDGRVHTTFTHNPSTLRLSSRAPNLQNIPRGGDSEVQRLVKAMFVAPEGKVFYGRDFSGIEAVLVGYFATDPGYIRLAKMDVHSFFTAWSLYELERKILYTDVPQLDWGDDALREALASIKNRFKAERTYHKPFVHGGNYRMGAKTAQEELLKQTGHTFSVQKVQKLFNFYFNLFPSIPKWHGELCKTVDGTKTMRDEATPKYRPLAGDAGVSYVQNPWGYRHHFYQVLDWKRIGDQWTWAYGEDAKRLIAFLPQSTAAAICKEAALQFWEKYPNLSATLRLLIHDELFGECEEDEVERIQVALATVMEQPWAQLPMPEGWRLGSFLSIGSEAKSGKSWGLMK